MDFQATFTRALTGECGQVEMTFTTTDKAAVARLKTLDRAKTLDVRVVEHKEKRSTDANAYFHVLCNEIAKKLKTSTDEVKANLVINYGSIATLEDGKPFKICIPKGASPFEFYKYCRWIGENRTGQGDWYILYKQTHTLNKEEMGHLIDGAIGEAKALDIETRTPEEIADMKSLWEQAK